MVTIFIRGALVIPLIIFVNILNPILMVKQILECQGMRLVHKDFVLQKVSFSSYANGTSLYNQGKSPHWATMSICEQEYVVFESLTKLTQDKLGNIQDLLNESILSIPKKNEDKTFDSEIELVLEVSYTQKRLWLQFAPLYQDRFLTTNEIMKLIRTHSVVSAIMGLVESGHMALTVFNTFQKVKHKFHLHNFSISSYKYFIDKLQKLQNEGIENALINGNKFGQKDGILSLKYIRKKVIQYYAQNKPVLKYEDIVNAVNHDIEKKGYSEIKLWVVKRICGDPEIQNTYKPFRLGKKWAEENLEAFLVRSLPADVHDKWELDGTVLPFYTFVNGMVTRLWYVIALDVHSRKVIAWAVGRHETSLLVLELYRQAIVNTHCLPVEIVHDNSSGFTSKLIIELECVLEDLGCFVRNARVGNAKDKGSVEKVQDIIHLSQFGRYYPQAWLGDSWDSDREQYRLEPVEFQGLRKKSNVSSINETIAMVRDSINRYNETIF